MPSENSIVFKNLENTNIAADLDEKVVNDIAGMCIQGFNYDMGSRKEWETRYQEWLKMAAQVSETKTWPWQNAANVKFPLIATASMQFAARAYPSLVTSPKLVNVRVYGDDPDGLKADRAKRLGEHMSYQILNQMDGWEEDMDRLLSTLPNLGCMFKKVYYSGDKKKNFSKLIYPRDFVVDYWATDIKSAYRKTHILYLTRNEIKERQNLGMYIEDYDPTKSNYQAVTDLHLKALSNYTSGAQGQDDQAATLPILEMHTWYDLDEDGYAEPYVITLDPNQRKVLRMVVGYDEDGIKIDGNNIVCIEQHQYFVKYEFLPSPDGGFYGAGFGSLLGSLSMSIDTLVNQILDSGTIYNLQSGWISKGAKIKGGDQPFAPGEWKLANVLSDDIRKMVMPLPAREPSTVLFQLLGMLVESGNKLASVAEIFTGKMPGQNTPATTTMATVEQGMKVFTAIYKRIYRSLEQEYRKLYDLNAKNLDFQEEFTVLDSMKLQQIGQSDYQGDNTEVCPGADPQSSSDAERLIKAQAIMEWAMQFGGLIDPHWAIMKMAEAMKIDDIEKGFAQQPQPSPEEQQMQMKQQESQAKVQAATQLAQIKMESEKAKMQMDQERHAMEMQHEKEMADMENRLSELQAQNQEIQSILKIREQEALAHSKVQTAQMQHEQKIRHGEETHKQRMKEANANKRRVQ